MMMKKETIFKFGKLEVFSVESMSEYYTPYIMYYWKDTTSAQSNGPFNTINDAVRHYEYLLETIKNSKNNPTEATVIRADFATKRRLDP